MIQIGSLLVCLEQRNIQLNGITQRIGARAFDILEVLYRANGLILSKDEIMNAVWPGQIVGENCLQVHIAALRKLLGADRDLIKTVPGRGYLLGPIGARSPDARVHPEPVRQATTLPGSMSPLFGRAAEVEQVIALLDRGTVTTVVGAGGIGKTSLALHLANQIRCHDRAVYFVELAKTASYEAVLAAAAETLKLPIDGHPLSAGALSDALIATDGLLVLDNAEHVIDVVARLVEALIAHDPSVRVLVTSREALRIRAETVLRLEPLSVPESGLPTDAMLEYSAIRLFLNRAQSVGMDCPTDERSVALIADICRRLDGLPLAIELAAARVATLGVECVASRLDQRLDLLTGGLRSALPRHQTLRATFEWSYALLDSTSRSLFRRLGCFTGTFSFDAVCAIAAEPGTPVAVVVSSLCDLAMKSLLNVEFRGPIAKYRLTESTRAYALEKLRDEGEVHSIAARHVCYLRKYTEENGLTRAQGRGGPTEFTPSLSMDNARTAYE